MVGLQSQFHNYNTNFKVNENFDVRQTEVIPSARIVLQSGQNN